MVAAGACLVNSSKPALGLPFPAMDIDLRTPWRIGGVEVPTRLVLAPMAGVSVQAFRRQGRRYGAGLVCSEMVSCAGIEHRNERTLGYLRVAADEHPLAEAHGGAGVHADAVPGADGAQLLDLGLDEAHRLGCGIHRRAQSRDVPGRTAEEEEAVATEAAAPPAKRSRAKKAVAATEEADEEVPEWQRKLKELIQEEPGA